MPLTTTTDFANGETMAAKKGKQQKPKRGVNANSRNNTREKILRAAMREFSDKGFSGARVDKIASRAKVNIRMIYYFFGSKKSLLQAVLDSIFQQRKGALESEFSGISDLLDAYLNAYSSDPERVRLLLWETLQSSPKSVGQLPNYEERKTAIEQRIETLAKLQQSGLLPQTLDPKFLYLTLVALTIFPMTFPQTVFFTTGFQAESEDFQHQYRDYLQQLMQLIFSTK